MNSILVICEGNICRSPMAQGLLAAALPNAQVHSAGLGALVGMPAECTCAFGSAAARSPCAIGLRQMLPSQRTRMLFITGTAPSPGSARWRTAG